MTEGSDAADEEEAVKRTASLQDTSTSSRRERRAKLDRVMLVQGTEGDDDDDDDAEEPLHNASELELEMDGKAERRRRLPR